MCVKQRFRPACAYAQSDQSLCKSLEYSINVQLLAEQHLEFLSLKGGLNLHLSKCHIVGNHMSWLILLVFPFNSFLASGNFCMLHLIFFTNSLHEEQDQQNFGPDLDLNRLTL